MEKSVKITLIIALAIISVLVIGILGYLEANPTNTITVSGQSTIKAVPDLVSVYFNIETTGKNAQEAKDANSEIVEKVILSLILEGFERKEIATENFNIYPEYDWTYGTSQIKGYKAAHALKLEIPVEDSENIGEIIDAGVDAGASITYINFELSPEKYNLYKAESFKEAAEDAKIKAEAVALGLGKKLGGVVSTSTSDFYYSPWGLYENSAGTKDSAVAREAVTDIHPGEQDVSGMISVVYRIR